MLTGAAALFDGAGTGKELARAQPDGAPFVAQALQQGGAVGGQDLPLPVQHQQTGVRGLQQSVHNGAVAHRPHLCLKRGRAGAFVGHRWCYGRVFTVGLRHRRAASLGLG